MKHLAGIQLAYYRAARRHSDESVATLGLHAPAHVDWVVGVRAGVQDAADPYREV